MQRTEYWNQTRPTDTQLNWTETSKTNAINQRLRSSAQMGIAWGFQCTVNSVDNTKIDVARGEGYTGGMFLINEFETDGSGQRISTYTDSPSGTDDTGPAATGQALADYTAGVLNYVSLVYTETESQPLAERSYPFTNRRTIVTETFTVSVLTATQWAALDSEALNNRILVAIVTPKGAGVALTSADIDQFVQPRTHPTASAPTTLSGVSIVGLADTTPLGIATLRWDSSTNQMYYTAPGDNEGTGVTISDSGTFELISGNTSYTIEINVVFGSLSGLGDITESISIQGLYGRQIPMFSGVDQIHRDMTGSGQATTTNPHGLTLEDIGGGTLDHADLFHVNGISHDADSGQLLCQIGISDNILVTNLGGFANSFLIDGATYTLINGVAAGTDGEISFDTSPNPLAGDYMIYLDSAANLQSVRIGGYTPPGAADGYPLWSTNIEIIDMANTQAGTGRITWDTTDDYLTWASPADGVGSPGAPVYVPSAENTGYYKLYSATTDDWIIVNVTGSLGASNSSDIVIAMTITDHNPESMLKLAVVQWTGGNADVPPGTENLLNIRDIRGYITADNRDEFLEEHDANGNHTKVLQNRFRVNIGTADSKAILAYASNSAIYGYASVNAVIGVAESARGVVAQAANTALSALALTNTGGMFVADETAVWGSAGTYGLYGTATDSIGVFGTAPNSGVYGEAVTAHGVFGTAPLEAIKGQADMAAGTAGVRGDASNIGVFGTASTQGVLGWADDHTGVRGYAASNYGVYGRAQNYGLYGTASTNYGVDANAPNIGGRISAATNTGLFATANSSYGLVAEAAVRIGVSASASSEFGLIAYADSSAASILAGSRYGLIVDVSEPTLGNAGPYGIFAFAGQVAGSFHARSSAGAVNVIGLIGSALNLDNYNSAIAIQANMPGAATNSGATGFYADAGGEDATGVVAVADYATGAGKAIYASANGANGVGVYAVAHGTARNAIWATGGSVWCGEYFGVSDNGALWGGVNGTGTAVMGAGSGSDGIGVFGVAADAVNGGTGLYGSAAAAGTALLTSNGTLAFNNAKVVTTGMAVRSALPVYISGTSFNIWLYS